MSADIQGEQKIEFLRSEAERGSAAAARALGVRLLVGRDAPFDPKKGLALLVAAACQGLHAALPITRNEKFILSPWIHDRPFAASA